MSQQKKLSGQLSGRKEIAQAFRTSEKRVTLWIQEGAPIFRVGNRLHADYTRLVLWLEETKSIPISD